MFKNVNEFKKAINNENIAVIGVGISNVPLIKFLLKNGAKVTAFDKKTPDKLGKVYDELKDLGINTLHILPIHPPGMKKAMGTAGSVYSPAKFPPGHGRIDRA